jgi:hypothetical protein
MTPLNISNADSGSLSAVDACRHLWRLSEISQETLVNALQEVCDIDYIDQDVFLLPENLMTAAENIIRSRATEIDKAVTEEMINAMHAAEAELNIWLQEILLYAPHHPELWRACAFFLERLLRGEVDEPPHDSFSAGLERLQESLKPGQPIDSFWQEAWDLQCRVIRHNKFSD